MAHKHKQDHKPVITDESEMIDQVGHEEVQEEVEDRSAFNCPTCKGDGLVNDFTKCPQCFGTGKI